MENITQKNITHEELKMLKFYTNGFGTNYQTFDAGRVLLNFADSGLTMDQAQAKLGSENNQLNYFDRKRWCGPNIPGQPIHIDESVTDILAIRPDQIPKPCFHDCYFGIQSVNSGKARTRCPKLYHAAFNILNHEKNLINYNYRFELDNPEIDNYLIRDILLAYNKYGFAQFSFRNQATSKFGVSRELNVVHEPSNRSLTLGGIGIVKVNKNLVSWQRPDSGYTVHDYKRDYLQKGYTGMSTRIIHPDGSEKLVENYEPLGGYSIEAAYRKWSNTQTAREIFSGLDDISVPEDVLLLVDRQNKLAGIVYSYPVDNTYPSQMLFDNKYEQYFESFTLLGKALRRLHDNNLIHAQPGNNWSVSFQDSKHNLILRDFSTLYSINGHTEYAQQKAKFLDIWSAISTCLVAASTTLSAEYLAYGYTDDSKSSERIHNFLKQIRNKQYTNLDDVIGAFFRQVI